LCKYGQATVAGLGGGKNSVAAGLPWKVMAFPIKTCVVCGEEFELRPGKPGFANRCPECSDPETAKASTGRALSAEERQAEAEANEARRKAIRDLLYRKDS
jgi:predicted RNA-binding Zn-ribbon protein involved in translation (DUF1610 family)